MHDATLCSEAGVPATVVITQPFQALAKQTCANVGLPDFATMVIAHPLWTRNDAWIDATAANLADRLIPVLFGGATSSGHERCGKA